MMCSPWGTMLRRTYRTIVADLEIDWLVQHFLQGHKPPGVGAGYIQKAILSSGPAMRAAQRRVSARIVKLLHS